MVLTKVLLLFLVRINAMKILRIATQNKYCIALFATQNKFLKSNAEQSRFSVVMYDCCLKSWNALK